jgi:hypothetical protein
MKRFTRVAGVLLALLIALGVAKAAVMTTNVRVTGSVAAGFNISYILAQDATTMSVKIYNSSNVLQKTISVADQWLMTAGPHENAIYWDGTNSGGSMVPVGEYYAQIDTTGAAVSALTLISGPVMQVDPATPALKDGRYYYGLGVNNNPTSPYRNMAVTASTWNGSSAAQHSGVWLTNADSTCYALWQTPNLYLDWLCSSVLADGKIVVTGQGTGDVWVLNQDGTVYKKFGEVAGDAVIVTRASRAFGSADGPLLYYTDGSNVYSVDLSVSPIPAPTVLIPVSEFPGTVPGPRDFVINAAQDTIWISAGHSSATTPKAYVWRYTKDPGTGVWTKDAAFNVTLPTWTYAYQIVRVALSPDEQTLWVAINDHAQTTTTPVLANKIVKGVNPTTGADKGMAWTLDANAGFTNPQSMAVSHNGNIYVVTYSGNLTGTTGDSLFVLAPPDSGSSDSVRSFPFMVTAETSVRITSGPTIDPITFHSGMVKWTTNLASNSVVDFGASSGYYDQSITDNALTTNHAVLLENLDQNTQWYLTASSNLEGYNPVTSAEKTFKTTTLTISGVNVTNITPTSATVNWTTSEPSTTIVRYGLSSGMLDRTYTNNTLVTTHAAVLQGLSPQTQYYFAPESGWTTAGLTRTVGAESSFTTKAEIIMGANTLAVTGTTADLTIQTNVPTSAVLSWGTDPASLTNTINAGMGTAHAFPFTGLSQGTTYYYSVVFTAADGATLTTPGSALTTAVGGGATTTVTHSTAADMKPAVRTNLKLGSPGSLIQLTKQGIPGTPIAGPPAPWAPYYHAVVAYNGYLYLLGGKVAGTGAQVATVSYCTINADGSLGAWTPTTAMPLPYAWFNNMCFGYGGYIYIVGGGIPSTQYDVWYSKQNPDGTLGEWKKGTPMPQPAYALGRDMGSCIAVDGYICLQGGEDNNGALYKQSLMSRLNADGSNGPWFESSQLSYNRWMNRAASNNHVVYNYCGYESGVAFFNTVDVASAMPNGQLTRMIKATDVPGHEDASSGQNHSEPAAGLAAGKLLTATGRYGGNNPNPLIEYSKIAQDGYPGPFVTSTEVWPVSTIDLDGAVYNNTLYGIGGRLTYGATDSVNNVVILPMVDDPEDPNYVFAGTLDSSIIDFGVATNLKNIAISKSGGGNVEFRYRYAGDNAVFSDWMTVTGTSQPISGGARYIQYQLVLTGDGTTTPTVNSVTITTEAGAIVYNKTDVENALKIAGGMVQASAADKARLDKDADGAITLKDAAVINRMINSL